MPASPPNCRTQKSCVSTTTFGPPGRCSSSFTQRPIAGRTPKTSTSEAVTDIAGTRTGSPLPVITNDAPVDPPIAANTWFRSRQSTYLGSDAGQVAHDGCVS